MNFVKLSQLFLHIYRTSIACRTDRISSTDYGITAEHRRLSGDQRTRMRCQSLPTAADQQYSSPSTFQFIIQVQSSDRQT